MRWRESAARAEDSDPRARGRRRALPGLFRRGRFSAPRSETILFRNMTVTPAAPRSAGTREISETNCALPCVRDPRSATSRCEATPRRAPPRARRRQISPRDGTRSTAVLRSLRHRRTIALARNPARRKKISSGERRQLAGRRPQTLCRAHTRRARGLRHGVHLLDLRATLSPRAGASRASRGARRARLVAPSRVVSSRSHRHVLLLGRDDGRVGVSRAGALRRLRSPRGSPRGHREDAFPGRSTSTSASGSQTADVSFRPLLLNVTQGYYVNSPRARLGRACAIATPAPCTVGSSVDGRT